MENLDGVANGEPHEQAKEKRVDVRHDDRLRQFQRLYRATVRGFAIGLLLRGGLHGVTALARVAKRQSAGSLQERLVDSVRWACTLGCFGTVYVGADEAIRSLVGCHRCATPASFGTVAYLWTIMNCSKQSFRDASPVPATSWPSYLGVPEQQPVQVCAI